MSSMTTTVEVQQPRRLSHDEYHRLIEAGRFEGIDRVELIDGVLAEMSPKSPAHENAATWLTRWLIAHTDGDEYAVRVAGPLTIGGSEPEPDLAVIGPGTARPYHPAGAALVIEIASTSQRRDLVEKPPIYASAGIPEYWVLDLSESVLHVHRQPAADGYLHISRVTSGGAVTAVGLALPTLKLDELLAASRKR
jgi:Uma2 family endonuclease